MTISLCDGALELNKRFTYKEDFKPKDFANFQPKNTLKRCCKCIDNCMDKLNCSCWRLTIEKFIERPPTNEHFQKYKTKGYKTIAQGTYVIG